MASSSTRLSSITPMRTNAKLPNCFITSAIAAWRGRDLGRLEEGARYFRSTFIRKSDTITGKDVRLRDLPTGSARYSEALFVSTSRKTNELFKTTSPPDWGSSSCTELSSKVVDERERRRTLRGMVSSQTPRPRCHPGERYATDVEAYHRDDESSGGGDGGHRDAR